MEGDQKRLNCSFIGFSSDESSETSPSKSSIEGTPLNLSGGLTLIGFSDDSLDSFPSPSKTGNTIIRDHCPNDDVVFEPEGRPLDETVLRDSDEEEMEETVPLDYSDCSGDELDQDEQRNMDGKP